MKRKPLKWKMWAVVNRDDPEIWTPTLQFWVDLARAQAKTEKKRVIRVEVREIVGKP